MISFDQVFGLKPKSITYTDSDEILFQITERQDESVQFKYTKGFEKLIESLTQDDTHEELERLQQSEKLLERVLTELFYYSEAYDGLCYVNQEDATIKDHDEKLASDIDTFISDACLSL